MPSLGPSPPDCAPFDYDHPEISPYNYRPSLAAGIVFTVLFGLSTLLHAYQTFRTRRWWQITFVCGALGECLGWLARALAYNCAYSSTYFSMQISLLIFSPAFTTAGIYTILVFLLPLVGTHTSPLPRKAYLYIFVGVDITSILLQAIGGGMASSEASSGKNPVTGTNIMIAGILFQLASLCVFASLFQLVVFRGWKVIRANRSLVVLCAVTMLSVACVVIRGIYRSIELLQGWTGYLISNEKFTIALDGVMILIAVGIFNVFNPGVLLGKAGAGNVVSARDAEEGEVEDKP